MRTGHKSAPPCLMETSKTREDDPHGRTRKYRDELRERATRMAIDARKDPETTGRRLQARR